MGRILGRIFILVTALAFGGGAVFVIVSDLKGERTIVSGQALLDGSALSPDFATRVFEQPISLLDGPPCRGDLLKGGLAVAVGLLDAVVAGGDVKHVDPALQLVVDTAKAVLACSPGRGFAWVWLASAADELGANPADLKTQLEKSLWTSPSEGWVMVHRLRAAANFGVRHGAGAEPIMRADIHTLLQSKASVGYVAELLIPVYIYAESILQDEFALIDDSKRKNDLMLQFGYWGLNIARCPLRRFNDWAYRGHHGSCRDEDKIPDFDFRK